MRDEIGCEMWFIDDGSEMRVRVCEPAESPSCSHSWVMRWAVGNLGFGDSTVAMIFLEAISDIEEPYRDFDGRDELQTKEDELFNAAISAAKEWKSVREKRLKAVKQ